MEKASGKIYGNMGLLKLSKNIEILRFTLKKDDNYLRCIAFNELADFILENYTLYNEIEIIGEKIEESFRYYNKKPKTYFLVEQIKSLNKKYVQGTCSACLEQKMIYILNDSEKGTCRKCISKAFKSELSNEFEKEL